MPSHCSNYACHRLIDEHGKVHPSSIVQVGKAEGRVHGHAPFNHEEQPFTQWLGGTILLTHEKRPPLTQGTCLEDYLRETVSRPLASSPPLYAWHTPLSDMSTPLSSPLTPLF